MLKFDIKTWSCAECGYRQDCEPTQENADRHFNLDRNFILSDIVENECPACSLKGVRGNVLVRETNPVKKSKMDIIESEADIEAIREKIRSKGPRSLVVGVRQREETDVEKAVRVDAELKGKTLNVVAKEKVKASMMALPNLTIEEPVRRQETIDEMEARIQADTDNLKPATPQEISELRAKYEDA